MDKNQNERIRRIERMEKACERIREALAAGKYDIPEFYLLSEYMESGAWQSDYEADEAGLIPTDIKRGVLSQDMLYDLLHQWEEERRNISE